MFRLCSLLLLLATPCFGEVLSGPVRVIDGDTIDIGADANIRLLGIDAPEADQTCRDGLRVLACGEIATQAVRAAYGGRHAICDVVRRDRYGRHLAVCWSGEIEINRDLVARGLARTYRDDATYAEMEKAAAVAGRGLWAYEMEDPATVRASAGDPPPGTCVIKGNISANGRIFHVPGQEHYDRTRINEGRGERWFCSEADAETAGWRRARR